MIRPLFSYYGSKWRSIPRYPKPQHETIIEPFAGSAGYSLRYPDRRVILCERDPLIADLWRYLIAAKPEEIRALPLIQPDQTVDDFTLIPEAKSLIGFWLNKGTAQPRKRPAAWFRSGFQSYQFWGKEIRERVAVSVDKIKHWQIIEGDYTNAPSLIQASWFIDPPYQDAGKHYKHGSKLIDYQQLSDWCQSLTGQVMVCENTGADWLPFTHLGSMKSTKGKSKEALWLNHV
mgnify:FL=1